MSSLFTRMTPFFLILFALLFIEAGITADFADARSRSGGRSFSRSTPAPKAPAATQSTSGAQTPNKSGFGRGLAGGLLGGALGGMLFGSMFGMGSGSGMGILPLLLLGGVGYFFYRRFVKPPVSGTYQGYQPPTQAPGSFFSGIQPRGLNEAVPPPLGALPGSLDEGLAMIRQTDPGFDVNHFVEVASDVFFKVQAGWMRRDIDSYRHLLGDELAAAYDRQFAEMRELGHINKLESISIRKVEIVAAGQENKEDFVTVLFTANLLDYTVDEHSDALVEGSMTDPVKFAEEWSWARPVGTEAWRLEGIKVVNG